MKNAGIFIGEIVKKIKEYKIIGYRKEYYINGNLKYEGKFLNDKYDDDNGKYIDEAGKVYLGNFKNGKKNGNFYVIKGEDTKLYEYKDDKLINKEKIDFKEDKKEVNNNGKTKKDEDKNEEDKKDISVICDKLKDENKDFLDTFTQLVFHCGKSLGDGIGFTCGCGHEAKSHSELGLENINVVSVLKQITYVMLNSVYNNYIKLRNTYFYNY